MKFGYNSVIILDGKETNVPPVAETNVPPSVASSRLFFRNHDYLCGVKPQQL